MAIVRTNYKITGREVDYDAIGGAIRQWYNASAITARRFGGLIMASFASQLSGVGFWQASAFELMGSTYGVSLVSAIWGSGFKVIPIAFMDASGLDSSPIFPVVSATQAFGVADNSVAVIVVRFLSLANGTITGYTLASNRSVHFVLTGLIVSGPNTAA